MFYISLSLSLSVFLDMFGSCCFSLFPCWSGGSVLIPPNCGGWLLKQTSFILWAPLYGSAEREKSLISHSGAKMPSQNTCTHPCSVQQMDNFYIKKHRVLAIHWNSLDQIKLANTQTGTEYRKLHLVFPVILLYFFFPVSVWVF